MDRLDDASDKVGGVDADEFKRLVPVKSGKVDKEFVAVVDDLTASRLVKISGPAFEAISKLSS